MAATSIDGIVLEKLEAMFLASATFSAEATGSNHIHFGDIQDFANQSVTPRPVVLLMIDDDNAPLIAGGDQNFLRNHGRVSFKVFRNNPTGVMTQNDVYLNQLDFVSNVLEEVANYQWPDNQNTLGVVRIVLDVFGEAAEEYWESLGRFYETSGWIHWGDEDFRHG